MTLARIAACAVLAGVLGSCANRTREIKPDTPPADTKQEPIPTQAGETYGPPLGPGLIPVFGPERLAVRPAVILFGPGRARGFAHLGVLRAFHEAKIPIAMTAGTEMGALFAVLFSQKASVNHVEWALLQFKDGAFGSKMSLLARLLPRRSAAIDSALEKVLSNTDLSSLKIPAHVILCIEDGECPVVERGGAAAAVKAAMSTETFLGNSPWNGQAARTAAQKRPFPIRELKTFGPVIAVNLGSDVDLSEADVIIRPDLADIDPENFNLKTEAAFRGMSAAMAMMKQIRHAVGLPEELAP